MAGEYGRPGGGGASAVLRELAVRYGVDLDVEAPADLPRIDDPADIARLLAPEMAGLSQEQLRVLLLDTKHHVRGQRVIYQGTVNHIPVRPAEIFRAAVAEGWPDVVVVHNHPSGDAVPSPQDVVLTRRLREVGDLLGVLLVDHVVIGSGGRYESMRELGHFL